MVGDKEWREREVSFLVLGVWRKKRDKYKSERRESKGVETNRKKKK